MLKELTLSQWTCLDPQKISLRGAGIGQYIPTVIQEDLFTLFLKSWGFFGRVGQGVLELRSGL